MTAAPPTSVITSYSIHYTKLYDVAAAYGAVREYRGDVDAGAAEVGGVPQPAVQGEGEVALAGKGDLQAPPLQLGAPFLQPPEQGFQLLRFKPKVGVFRPPPLGEDAEEAPGGNALFDEPFRDSYNFV